MTKKTGVAGGDNRDQNPEGTTLELTELRDLIVETQTATQSSIQQLSDAVGALTARLDALTTALTPRLDPQAQPEDENEAHRRLFYEDLRQRDNYPNRWEGSFKVDIPEFHGGLRGDDLVDWLITVKEILEFKQVPLDRRVPLVAMHFRGHAATWWKQLKTTRSRTGKEPIQSWEKLTKHLRQTFLPHNYERTMYTRLQNLRQGSRSVDEYAEEFSLLLTRNEINDSKVQLVSRFIGGLRQQLQTAMAQFDPSTVGEAHMCALSFEQQSRSSTWNTQSNRTRDQSGTNAPSTATKDASDTANPSTKPSTQEEQTLRRSTRPNALRCYSCGEHRHRQTACPHATRRGLVAEDVHDQDVYDSQEEEEPNDEDIIIPTTGDMGHMLVLRRSCITPRKNNDQWLRTNIFRSTCTINDRVRSFTIDSGSCRKVISEEAVTKVGLLRENHPTPYMLGWLNDSATVRISQRTLVSFSIVPYYTDRIYCDIAPMDISHLLLGRPWEFDRNILHNGADNTRWHRHGSSNGTLFLRIAEAVGVKLTVICSTTKNRKPFERHNLPNFPNPFDDVF
uniref:Retrotransposon gag domain-containing protein n=1 Tax=Brassica oleracea var. oleracea TaxID=109376 RepID=A0A0D3CDP4_BRAOL